MSRIEPNTSMFTQEGSGLRKYTYMYTVIRTSSPDTSRNDYRRKALA